MRLFRNWRFTTASASLAADVARRSSESCKPDARPTSAPRASDDVLPIRSCSLVECFEQRSLEVSGFWNGQYLRVIQRLTRERTHGDPATRIRRCRLQHFQKQWLCQMKAATR